MGFTIQASHQPWPLSQASNRKQPKRNLYHFTSRHQSRRLECQLKMKQEDDWEGTWGGCTKANPQIKSYVWFWSCSYSADQQKGRQWCFCFICTNWLWEWSLFSCKYLAWGSLFPDRLLDLTSYTARHLAWYFNNSTRRSLHCQCQERGPLKIMQIVLSLAAVKWNQPKDWRKCN